VIRHHAPSGPLTRNVSGRAQDEDVVV